MASTDRILYQSTSEHFTIVFFSLNRMDEIPNEDIRGPQKPGRIGETSPWGTHTLLTLLTHPQREPVKKTKGQLPFF